MSAEPNLDAIQARTDAAPLSAAAQIIGTDVPALVAALRAVLKVHRYRISADEPFDWCDECQDGPWPCATIRAITAHIDTTTTPKEN